MTPQLVSGGESVAREIMWTYTTVTEEGVDKEFYIALESQCLIALKRACMDNPRIWVGREINLKIGPYTLQAHLTNIEPVLATAIEAGRTTFLVHYRTRAKDEGQDLSRFISEVIRYPDEQMEAVYDSLIGLDPIKQDIVRKLTLLLQPASLTKWLELNYPRKGSMALPRILRERYPLFLLEGEVGAGKTALARSVGSRVARNTKSEILLIVVNAQVRGGGHVGELTQNISRAFDEAERRQEREQLPVMLLIDEADSLAQSRGGTQTHHEDDAGVNTLIQRIDRLRGKAMAVLFATNLARLLDPAIVRRACATYHFDRPIAEQREQIFLRILAGLDFDKQVIDELVNQTMPRSLPGSTALLHRYTYSDLVQRLLPQAIEAAVFNNQPLSSDNLLAACSTTLPTPEAATTDKSVPIPARRINRGEYYHIRKSNRE